MDLCTITSLSYMIAVRWSTLKLKEKLLPFCAPDANIGAVRLCVSVEEGTTPLREKLGRGVPMPTPRTDDPCVDSP